MNTYSVLILDDEEFSVDVLMEDIHWEKRHFPGTWRVFRPPGKGIPEKECGQYSDLRH